MPVDSVRVSLKYNGPDVDDGSMPLKDVLEALQGFAGAYDKIAKHKDPKIEHTLRVAAVKEGSFDLQIIAAILLGSPDQVEILQRAYGAAKRIFQYITDLIEAKRHTQGKPYTFNVSGNGRVNVFSFEKNSIQMDLETFTMFDEKLVDRDLHKLTKPLRKGRVDSATLSAVDDQGSISTTVTEEDKPSFDLIEQSTTTTATMKLRGQFVSMNKDRNDGRFRLKNGETVAYRYTGNDAHGFHLAFPGGEVEVSCEAILDENFQPLQLKITEAETLQRELPGGWLRMVQVDDSPGLVDDTDDGPKGLLPGGDRYD